MAKILSTYSDRLVQNCVTLSPRFLHKKKQHFTLSRASAHCFFCNFHKAL